MSPLAIVHSVEHYEPEADCVRRDGDRPRGRRQPQRPDGRAEGAPRGVPSGRIYGPPISKRVQGSREHPQSSTSSASIEIGDDPELGPFIAMELIDGSTLRRQLERTGPLDAAAAVAAIADIAERSPR